MNRISIHAPIVGCDDLLEMYNIGKEQFQSTHPSWGATKTSDWETDNLVLFQSTHPSWGATKLDSAYFTCKEFQSTHPSWGATSDFKISYSSYLLFQSTHPSWGATYEEKAKEGITAISIHAPIVGCDRLQSQKTISTLSDFNPRTHRGVRPRYIRKVMCAR